MNEGFTGFNPSQVINETNIFENYGEEIALNFTKAFKDFMTTLKTAWCSPKAVTFSKIHSEVFHNQIRNLALAYHNVAASAERAYNIHARANGYDPIDTDGLRDPLHYADTTTLDGEYADLDVLYAQSDSGVVGMNKMVVKTAVDALTKKMNEGFAMIDHTPYNIAFFDEDGSQKEAFKAEIMKMKEELVQGFLGILQSIDEAIETEVNTMELAKQQATQTLNG